MKCFKEFWWEKSEGGWGRCRRSRNNILWMALSWIRGEKFVVLSKANVGGGGRYKWIFVLKGEKVGGWWH